MSSERGPESEPAELEILLPVHNEGTSIEQTLREIHSEIGGTLSMRFVVCEDGSSDDTTDVLRRLEGSLPIVLLTTEQRKGYSQAVIDGMRAATAPYLLCLDSDGQCDPRDFWSFWERRERADVIVGYRDPRRDHLSRVAMSNAFQVIYRVVLGVRLADPSCPYVLMPSTVREELLPALGAMEEGFWWEFSARAHRRGLNVVELPVHHRPRLAGQTQIYRLRKLPLIAYRHVTAMFRLRREEPIRAHGDKR